MPHFTEEQHVAASKALCVWSEFLLGQGNHPAEFEQHVLPFDVVENLGGMEAPPNLNRYLLRSVDIDVARTPRDALVYSTMCGMLVLGIITRADSGRWKGTKVHVQQGALGPRSYELPMNFGKFIVEQAHKMAAYQEIISLRQRNKMDDLIASDADRVAS
jgi:hypothetical protein